jgi:hypothetical protein
MMHPSDASITFRDNVLYPVLICVCFFFMVLYRASSCCTCGFGYDLRLFDTFVSLNFMWNAWSDTPGAMTLIRCNEQGGI